MVFNEKQFSSKGDDTTISSEDCQQPPPRTIKFWKHWFGFGCLVAVALGATRFLFGQHAFEKTLTGLAAPMGLVWLLLLLQSYLLLLLRQSGAAWLSVSCWLLITIFGNHIVSNHLMFRLEKPHIGKRIQDTPDLDVVFLLGGGTTTNPNRNAQVADAGDRVVTAARLKLIGKADLIVCTGLQLFRTEEDDLHPHQEAAKILTDLGIDNQSIATIEGYNTYEETRLIVEFLNKRNMQDAKIGIVTSAWHLSRAQRLAESNGLSPFMIPADFRSGVTPSGPGVIIPSSFALSDSTRCAKEFFAFLVGR